MPVTRHRSTEELLLGLAIGLDAEHKARTGHEWTNRYINPCCDCCMWLRVIFDELERREYHDRLRAAAEA